jgi:hypothetical protein
MCCFSQPVRSVSNTSIFARSGIEGRQYVVYSMRLNSPHDVAMILPLPVAAGAGEKSVRFINLQQYPEIFTDLMQLFLPPSQGRGGFGGPMTKSAPRLEVQQVGSFEASYVPTVRDFSRLDERFQLPMGTWDKLPQYRSYGFAVFKLKPGAQMVHPMAFDFPRADPRRLFFPTVHIHDGRIHDSAGFDHTLYCQRFGTDAFRLMDWNESERFADSAVKTAQAQSVVIPKAHVYRKSLRGRLKNQDTWVG